ncbi:substrate-binding periplasmic protein [Roseibium sp.]|uniref:substrate-binding periplasmic protein n=1 Tax=Roseibium sp. TaxID=1936156 RepID=UPI003B52B1CA
MRLITSPWPPSAFYDANGHPTGIAVDMVTALKDQMGLSTPIEILPWARGYKIAEAKPNILLFTAGRTQERLDAGFEFIGPAIMWTHGLLVKNGSELTIESLEDARQQGITAVGVRGSWQVKLLKKAGIQTVETSDQGTGARMLLADRVDVWITSSLQASAVLKEIGVPTSEAKTVFTVRKSPSYLMISNGTDPKLLKKWRTAYEELKQSDTLQGIAKNWSDRLGVPLTYRPEDGFSAVGSGEDGTG